MHDDMVERVAKAMVASRPIPPSCNLGDVDWSFFRELARAAIEAMREAEPVAYLHRFKPGGRADEVDFEVAPNKRWTSEPLYILSVTPALPEAQKAE